MAGGGQGAQLQQLLQQQQGSMGGATPPMDLNSYASPNPGFMQYQGQGQPNQPPALSNALPATQAMAGPDGGGDYASANLGFDGSGSDGGIGGQPAPMQTPLQQGNKPLGLAQFQQPQGLQIAGNPTSQVVQRPQQR
jgi:hypothetical protein